MTQPHSPSSQPPRPRRVLHLLIGSFYGGVSVYVAQLCRALRESGIEATAAGRREALASVFDAADVPWINLPLDGGPVSLYRAYVTLKQAARGGRFDLIHAHHRKAALVGRRLARAFNLPLIYSLHLPGFPVGGPARWLTETGDHTHAVSEQAKRWLVDKLHRSEANVTVIPNGVDVERFVFADASSQRRARADMGLAEDAVTFAFVGRLERQKNPSWIVEGLGALRRDEPRPDARVVMVGAGPLEPALRARAESLGVSDRVAFRPWGDPRPVYRACDALLLPSAREGFGLVAAEALATGRPVLRTRTAGTEETIVEGVTGWSTPIRYDAFVDGWRTACRAMGSERSDAGAPGARLAMAHDCRTFAVERLDHRKQVERMAALYERLVQGSHSPR